MLASTCKDMTFGIVVEAKSPSEAWAALESFYHNGDTTEIRWLNREFSITTMTPGKPGGGHAQSGPHRLYRIVQHLEKLNHVAPEDQLLIGIAI